MWSSRSILREDKDIRYYRWSYRRLTEGDGSPLAAPGPWTPLTRTVMRHYAKPTPGGVTHEPYTLGPKTIGTQTNLFEIKPEFPTGGVEWTVVDVREDLASAHFETIKLGSGTGACTRAYNAAGKYELKLELFKDTGDIVDWTTEGIDLRMADVAAPFGTDAVTTEPAPDYNCITDTAGNTITVTELLAAMRDMDGVWIGPCTQAAFSEALHVWATCNEWIQSTLAAGCFIRHV